MGSRLYPPHRGPKGVSIPRDIEIVPPPAGLPDGIRVFFGKTGKWWGSWTSRQVKGTFDAILIVRRLTDEERAEAVYVVSDYPRWYVEGSVYETTGTFSETYDGRTVLLVPFGEPRQILQCWFEGRVFKGAIYNRFMASSITWELLD